MKQHLYILLKFIFFLFGASSIADTIYFWFELPASLTKFIIRPWTIFTYMFVHTNIWHFLINLTVFYFTGIIFLQFFTDKQLWRVFVLSGLSGGLLFLLAYNIFPVFERVRDFSVLLGASAGITGLILAVAAYKPNYSVLFFGILPMPLWLVAAIFLLFDLAALPMNNTGGHISHLGGALFGLYWGLKYRQGIDTSQWLANLFKRKRYKPRMKVHKSEFRPKDYEWNKNKRDIEKEIDRILEKIAKHGYNSLTKKEREFLQRHSKDYDGFHG